MKKALVVGINDYPYSSLNGCINDANEFADIIESNGDGSPNFDVRLHIDVSTKNELRQLVTELFRGESEVALFYFSGHGLTDETDTYLVTPDSDKGDAGFSMTELLTLVNKSKATNKVIFLDCCHSGALGTSGLISDEISSLNKGVTVLTASEKHEVAMEVNGHGVFTRLLLTALRGGAADICGQITPGGVYAYIDQALGPWDQRPVFKTNVKAFNVLRNVPPKITLEVLRKVTQYFDTPEYEFSLDPSYEYTNSTEIRHIVREPFAFQDHVEIFRNLQSYQSVGLVVPIDAQHMYFAAMESKSCKLTALGRHYWNLAKNKRF